MAAEYEAILRKIQEGLAAQKSDTEEEGGGGGGGGGGGEGGGGGGGGGGGESGAAAGIQQHQQQQQQPPQLYPQELQPQLPLSPSLKVLYDHICQRIRSTGSLEVIMKEFQELRSDLERVQYVAQLSEVKTLVDLQENYNRKNGGDATNYEKVYDMLIPNETSANKALEVMKKCIQKTPPEDTTALAVRYMKRGWASLLLEQFNDAQCDARISLSLPQCPENQLWNSHEILGHCSARIQDCKAAEKHFHKALENLRKSNATNEVKATATVRIMTVFKTVKAKKGKKVEEDKPNEKIPLPQVTYGTHKTFVSASSAVDFVITKDRSRCTVAKRDIKPGDIVMVDTPFCSMMNPDFVSTNCYYCYLRCSSSLPCISCATVNYCSVKCRTTSWEQGGHKEECKVFNHLTDPGIGKLALLAFRVMTTTSWSGLQKWRGYIDNLVMTEARQSEEETDKHEGGKENIPDANKVFREVQEIEDCENKYQMPEGVPFPWEGKYHPKDYKTVLHLATNSFQRTFGDLFKRSITAVYLAYCLKISGYFGSENVAEEDLIFAASMLLRHLQGGSCNAYEIGEMDIGSVGSHLGPMQEIGGALYTTISLTNHSCVSNVVRYSVGDKCVLRAVRPIPCGAEVCDNYGFYFHSSTVNERHEVLQSQYKFTCSCRACSSMWPLYPHHPQETLIFRCPSKGCHRSCCYSTSCRNMCNVCGNKQQYAKLLREIEQQLNVYKTALDQVKTGNIKSALPALITHITFMNRHCVEPVKHFTDAQEAIKQCYNCHGNVHRPPQIVAPAQAEIRHATPKLKPSKREIIMH
ncbi:hypothetical protein Pmani_030953 [Petrolisthes manimaculis]|uniref:Protein-lysine N-methyltransferase SMYD4 n=1 Tax=Petrolisthes manimaculis TaxID=1843537 RepID=A0AAE1NUK8_9EUCA|nr:hypothetical protein Pmani_030953 [Petrolisthes manimaculis]